MEDRQYFDQLTVYIHLTPVRAGLVSDPAGYGFSGHRELLGEVSSPSVDVDEALVGFGRSLRGARWEYLSRMSTALAEGDSSRGPLSPPRQRGHDRDLELEPGRAYVDEVGRSTGLERPRLEAADLLALACKALGTHVVRLASTRRDSETARLRMLAATVGIERWGQRAGVLATVLRSHPDGVSRWVNRGARFGWPRMRSFRGAVRGSQPPPTRLPHRTTTTSTAVVLSFSARSRRLWRCGL